MEMRRPTGLRVPLALLTATVLLGLTLMQMASPPTAATAAPSGGATGWCGPSPRADWACGWTGTGFLTPRGGTEQPLLQRRPLPLPRESRVKVGPSGSARLAFRAQAHCTVGGRSAEASEVVTRWEDVLMRQISGDSSCTIRGEAAPVTTFCEASEKRCPVRIRALGTFLLQGPGAFPEALASLSGSFERHARLVICDGVARIKIEGEAEEAVGSANGRNRFVITIHEAIAHAEAEATSPSGSSFAEATASILTLTVIGTVRGPGPCKASVVQGQQRSVGA